MRELEHYIRASVITRGKGLSVQDRFRALKSDGAYKVFSFECFFHIGKDKVKMISLDFKDRICVEKECVLAYWEYYLPTLKEIQDEKRMKNDKGC